MSLDNRGPLDRSPHLHDPKDTKNRSGWDMRLFTFASKNLENIHRGVKAKLWAVATVRESQMKGRETKARKYMHPGDVGLLYCNETQSFTVPLIVDSKADPARTVFDVWPEPWKLPFSIQPLGSLSRQLPHDEAKTRWSFLQRRLRASGGVTAAMNITGVTVFVPVEIVSADWEQIVTDLGDPPRI